MTNDWNERRGLILTLGAAALGLWGYNGYQVLGAARADALPGPPPATTVGRGGGAPARYEGGGRDPFRPPRHLAATYEDADSSLTFAAGPGAPFEHPPLTGEIAPDPAPAPPMTPFAAPVPPGPPPPLLHLAGVVGRTALLVDPAGSTHSLAAGEAVAGVAVLVVERAAVVIEADGRRYTLSLGAETPTP